MVKLDADVRDEFTWNTKQLFMFLSVEYATPANPNNQLVMWSKIILSQVCPALPVEVLNEYMSTCRMLCTWDQEAAVSARIIV